MSRGHVGELGALGGRRTDARADVDHRHAITVEESIGTSSQAGGVNVLYGTPNGLRARGAQLWTQASPGVPSVPDEEEFFGGATVAANLGKGPQDDLAIGVPQDHIGDLADVEEHLGNKQRSVELLAEAYAKAKGPASRFQWGYQYLEGLLRLTPDDLATIEKVGLQVMAELDGPNSVHRRTLSRLNKLDAELREWNTSPAREAVAAKLRARVPHTAST